MSKSKIFVQTKLNFGPPKPTTVKTTENDYSIEEQVSRLKLGLKHPSICPNFSCKAKAPKVVCTAVKADGSVCRSSWCEECIGKFSKERIKDIKKSTDHKKATGYSVLKEDSYIWNCPVCRNLCVCSFCKTAGDSRDNSSESKLTPAKFGVLQFGKPAQTISPPTFSCISLVYPEEEIWTRLKVREFIYQFGNVCRLEHRLISSLQNVQGDWRIRRLSVILVWHALLMIGNFSIGGNNNSNNNSTIDPEIQRLTRQMVNEWASSFGLSRTAIPNTKERLERTGELLSKKGMTGDKWQQVAELLAKADFRDLPIPTSNLMESLDVKMDDGQSEDMETSSMDFENEHETIDYQIKKFRALKRSPLSTQEELYMVEILFDMVLMDGRVRQQIMEATKHLKTMKDFKAALDLQRHQINSNRQIGEQEEAKMTATELDKQEIEAMITTMRSDNRLQRLITPWDDNEYWLFHDLLSPQQHSEGKTTELQSREPYWAHGVILIGKCPTLEDVGETEMDKQQQRGWWYLYGIEDIRKLDNWLASCLSVQKGKGTIEKTTLDITGNDIKVFQTHLGRRIEYLRLLERAIYGNGHFS